jgi:hypothetical protein
MRAINRSRPAGPPFGKAWARGAVFALLLGAHLCTPPAYGSGAGALAAMAGSLCAAADAGIEDMARLVDAEPGEEHLAGPAMMAMRVERTFARRDGTRIVLSMSRPGGHLRLVSLEAHAPANGGHRPEFLVLLDGACELRQARRIAHDNGLALEIVVYGPDLTRTDPPEPLNPPMPEQPATAMQDGPVVALFDSGLAYTLPEVADRLVYGPDGHALGYDFWDMNDRPFDADTSRSPFFPARHGTAVASVLLREAPSARVVPFRYPRPDMRRMADMVAAASRAGARVVVMAMGSNDPTDWETFASAARAHDHILFVLSAGNDDRNLDDEPLWPAALGLRNAVVVTSSDGHGRLAPGSNRGAGSVDLAVPGEHIEVHDHRGRAGRASGTSYAVPRVAALAARMLERNPEMHLDELKAGLFSRAAPAADLRHGVILDPAAAE